MRPTEEQIKQLMATLSCAVCGAAYDPASVDVLGHREELWFLRVSCTACATSGLVAALVRESDEPSEDSVAPRPVEADASLLDLAPNPGPVTRSDVLGMRRFLAGFDGNFGALFGEGAGPHRPAA